MWMCPGNGDVYLDLDGHERSARVTFAPRPKGPRMATGHSGQTDMRNTVCKLVRGHLGKLSTRFSGLFPSSGEGREHLGGLKGAINGSDFQ